MSKNNETIPAEAAPQEMPGLKLDVHVKPIVPTGNLLGFASVTINDSIKIDNFRICSGDKGLYAMMPSVQDGQGKWRDICWPVNADFRKQLTNALIDGYGAAIESLQATLDATRSAAERPSVTGSLKDKGKEVKASQPKSPGKGEPSR